MKIIVIGCGRVGSELAYRLFQRGHRVTVVDITSESFNNLPPDFRGRTIEGDPLNQQVLHRAGIEQSDGIALVTNSDSVNAVVAHVARQVYGMKNVIVRNYDPNWRLLYEAFHLQMVSSSSWGAQRIEELLYNVELRSVFAAGNGEVEIYEFTAPDAWNGKTIDEIMPPDTCIPVSITRSGHAILPTGGTVIESGDVMLISATLDGVEGLRQCIISGEEE